MVPWLTECACRRANLSGLTATDHQLQLSEGRRALYAGHRSHTSLLSLVLLSIGQPVPGRRLALPTCVGYSR